MKVRIKDNSNQFFLMNDRRIGSRLSKIENKNPSTQDLTQMDRIRTVDFQWFLRFYST
jgi:hypothetical protein